jgi:hypothetical protein
MAVGESDARVDESTRDELGTGLFCGALEGELREESGSGVVGEGYVEDLCGAALDGSDDEFTDTGGVLKTISSDVLRLLNVEVVLTLPRAFSTRIAFFCRSVTSWPAIVGTMSLGGTWRKPGPRRRGFLGCEGM